MSEKKLVGFRLEVETYKKLQIYAIQNNTTVQAILEEHVLKLLK